MKLKRCWVQTLDHCEDWFIVVSTVTLAERLHQRWEGYDPGGANAEEIIAIPDTLTAKPGWPSEQLLEAVGASGLESGAPNWGQRKPKCIYSPMPEEACMGDLWRKCLWQGSQSQAYRDVFTASSGTDCPCGVRSYTKMTFNKPR